MCVIACISMIIYKKSNTGRDYIVWAGGSVQGFRGSYQDSDFVCFVGRGIVRL